MTWNCGQCGDIISDSPEAAPHFCWVVYKSDNQENLDRPPSTYAEMGRAPDDEQAVDALRKLSIQEARDRVAGQ